MTQMGFYFDATRCTGCHTCEAACRDYNDLDLGFSFRHVFEIEGGGWEQDAAGCWVTDSYTYYTSFSCQHCDNPACTSVCPTGAMHKDRETGVVSVDEKRCVGCGYCAMACPYGNPQVNRQAGHSTKCDACSARTAQGLQPACVDACSMRALQFGPIDQLPQGDGRAFVAPLPDPAVTGPNLYIKNCANAQPTASSGCRVANKAEVE
ncbi:MAG: DMSO/selenate family reductase complex B subunit [Coriobacteriales bacterium]